MFPIEIYDRVHLHCDIRTGLKLRSTCKTLYSYRFTRRYRNVAEQLEKFLIKRPTIQSYRIGNAPYAVLHLSPYVTLFRLIITNHNEDGVFLWKADLSYASHNYYEIQKWETSPIDSWLAEPDLREQNRRIFGRSFSR